MVKRQSDRFLGNEAVLKFLLNAVVIDFAAMACANHIPSCVKVAEIAVALHRPRQEKYPPRDLESSMSAGIAMARALT
jgi:hypothetical protein